MTETPTDDKPDFVAKESEHCLDCIRLINPGETYHQGQGGTVLCPNCVSGLLIGEDFDTIQATEQVAVDYGGGLIRLRRDGAAIIVAPQEVLPLIVPLTLLKHHLSRYPVPEWVLQQVYLLHPYPKELMLHNHV